jgi:hypothetical protein
MPRTLSQEQLKTIFHLAVPPAKLPTTPRGEQDATDRRSLIKTLSLVHRSWTIWAQEQLFSRVHAVADSRDGLEVSKEQVDWMEERRLKAHSMQITVGAGAGQYEQWDNLDEEVGEGVTRIWASVSEVSVRCRDGNPTFLRRFPSTPTFSFSLCPPYKRLTNFL